MAARITCHLQQNIREPYVANKSFVSKKPGFHCEQSRDISQTSNTILFAYVYFFDLFTLVQ